MNIYLLIGIVVTILAIVPLIFYIIPLQYLECRQPKSSLRSINKTRELLLMLEVVLALAMVPGLPRKLQALHTPAANNWARLASVTNPLPFLLAAIILVVIYRQKLD